MIVHEDARRILFDWSFRTAKSSKAVIIKKEIVLGNHYHENKDEEFLLLTGEFLELQIDDKIEYNVKAPRYIDVPRNTYHRFICKEGSILLGTATEIFDGTDEIKKQPQTNE